MIEIIILYNKIDLKKATTQGLELMFEILVGQEWYEQCIDVLKELNNRK